MRLLAKIQGIFIEKQILPYVVSAKGVFLSVKLNAISQLLSAFPTLLPLRRCPAYSMRGDSFRVSATSSGDMVFIFLKAFDACIAFYRNIDDTER